MCVDLFLRVRDFQKKLWIYFCGFELQNEVRSAYKECCEAVFRGGFRVQKKVVTNFCKIDTIYIKVIALIFVVIIVVIIIIANVAILFLL